MPCRDCNAPVRGRAWLLQAMLLSPSSPQATLLQHATKKRPLEDRFLDFFNKIIPTEKGCMEWPGGRQGEAHNYGIITTEFKGKGYSQHHTEPIGFLTKFIKDRFKKDWIFVILATTHLV